MLKGFKDFLMRGNVVELAVAVVIGTAFAAVVKTVLDNLVKPILAAIGGANVSGLGVQLVDGNPHARIDFAEIINALIVFLITAAVVYFILIMPMNKFAEMKRRRLGLPEPTEPASTEDLLTEIRDLLAAQQGIPTTDDVARQNKGTEPSG